MADVVSFFDNDTPHGLVKRMIYKKYLQAFIAVTQHAKSRNGQQSWKTLIIDGFAGTGRYGESWPKEIEKYGSPLIALKIALNFFKNNHTTDKRLGKPSEVEDTDQIAKLIDKMSLKDTQPVNNRVFLIFNEADKDNFKKLRDNITEVLRYFFRNSNVSYKEDGGRNGSYCFQIVHPNYPIHIRMYNKKFEELHIGDQLLSDFNVKCLTFLDPFGYSQIPFEAVRIYLGENKSVLINFMSSCVNRFVRTKDAVYKLYGIEMFKKQKTTKEFQDDPSLKNFLKYVVKNLNQAGGEKPTGNIETCTAMYENALKSIPSVKYTLSFEMRGKKNNIIYHLIFATGHIKDIEIMKEPMNRCTQFEHSLRMSDYTFLQNGSQLTLNNTQDCNSVADAVFKRFNGKTNVSINKIKEFVLLDTPFVFQEEVLQSMQVETDPRIKDVRDKCDNRPEQNGTFPDGTEWFLTFKDVQEEEVDEADDKLLVANIIFRKFKGQSVLLSDIKRYLTWKTNYRFKKGPLSIMEKEKNPRIEKVQGPIGVSRRKGAFPDRLDWHIYFRNK